MCWNAEAINRTILNTYPQINSWWVQVFHVRISTRAMLWNLLLWNPHSTSSERNVVWSSVGLLRSKPFYVQWKLFPRKYALHRIIASSFNWLRNWLEVSSFKHNMPGIALLNWIAFRTQSRERLASVLLITLYMKNIPLILIGLDIFCIKFCCNVLYGDFFSVLYIDNIKELYILWIQFWLKF